MTAEPDGAMECPSCGKDVFFMMRHPVLERIDGSKMTFTYQTTLTDASLKLHRKCLAKVAAR